MEANLIIRSSSTGLLMTEPKFKSDKDAGNLGDTAKGLVEKIWLQNKYGYKEDIVTDEMMKGLICEQDSMALVQKVLGGEFRTKNTERFKNDYQDGCPDVILKQEDFIEDLKSSYNLRTYFESEYKQGNAYWWQGQSYMWLTGKLKYRLIYCLVPTPDEYILEQKKRFYYKFNCDETNKNYIDISMQIDKNNELIKEIPAKERIKVFEFAYDADAIEKFKVQHEKAVNYYKSLKLNKNGIYRKSI